MYRNRLRECRAGRNIYVFLGAKRRHRRNGNRSLRRNLHVYHHEFAGLFNNTNIQHHPTTGADSNAVAGERVV